MEDKDKENDNKSESQAKPQSEVNVSNEAEGNAEETPAETPAEPPAEPPDEPPAEPPVEPSAEPSVEPSVKQPSVVFALSHNSNLVTAPSIVNTKSTPEKSRSNLGSPNKVSIKTTGENEEVTQKAPDQSPKEDVKASSQLNALFDGGGGGGTSGEIVKSSGKGAVVASGGGGGGGTFQGEKCLGVGSLPYATGLLQKRSPFIHNPPYPEERRARVQPPRTPIDYIINLREDLADFQESHGLPRTRDYSFVSLGLALAQETGRAILSVFQMFTELFPILAIVSLILRFALDKLIEILETTDTMAKIKKSIVFALEMLAIMIPLWILFGTIIIPLITLILSLFKRVLRIKGGKKKPPKPKPKVKPTSCVG